MPVLDGSFEAFVTNLGKYNEGELVGEWVHFPTTEEEMKKVFERIGIGSKDEFGQVYDCLLYTSPEEPVEDAEAEAPEEPENASPNIALIIGIIALVGIGGGA